MIFTVVVCGASALATFAFFGLILLSAWNASAGFEQWFGWLVLPLIGVLFLLVPLIPFWKYLGGTKYVFAACDRGFVCVENGKTHIRRWGEVREFWKDVQVHEVWFKGLVKVFDYEVAGHALVLHDDTRLELVPGTPHDLIRVLERKTYDNLLARHGQAIRQGQTVEFGKFVDISPCGLGYKKDDFDWEEIDEVTLAQGKLEVLLREDENPIVTMPTNDVPNLLVFITLSNRLAREARKPRRR